MERMEEQREEETKQGNQEFMDSVITKENLWEVLIHHQGETFYTVKKLPFTYQIRGGEFFTDRKKKSITKSTFEQAFQKIQEDVEHKITGPKSLCCFGGPYVWAMFKALGIVS